MSMMSLNDYAKDMMWRSSAVCLGAALPAILIGNAVMVGLVLLGVIFGVVATSGNSLRSSVRLLAKSFVARMILLLLAILLAGSFTAPDVNHALDQFGEVGLVAVVAMGLFILLREMPTRFTRLLVNVLAVGTLIMMAIALVDLLIDYPRLATAIHGSKSFSDRHLADMLSPNRYHFLSGVLAVITPFLWVWLVKLQQELVVDANKVAFPLAGFAAIAVFVTGGAAGLVALLVAGGFFLAIAADQHAVVIHKKHWLFIAIFVVVAVLVYWLANGHLPTVPHIPALELANINWAHVFADPLYGTGIGSLDKPTKIALLDAPMLIRVLAEIGVVAGGLLIFLAFYLLWVFYRFAQRELYGLAGFASLLAFFTMSVLDTYLFNAWWLCLGILPILLAGRIGWSLRK
jgi:hypothetical protein